MTDQDTSTTPVESVDSVDQARVSERAKRGFAATVPLFFSFLLLPLFLSLVRGAYNASDGITPIIDNLALASRFPLPLIWAALALFGALWLAWKAARPRKENPSTLRRILQYFEVLLMLATACLFLAAVQDWATPRAELVKSTLDWLGEMAPLVYFLFAGLWCLSFGIPSRKTFRMLGYVLAAMTLADAALGLITLSALLPAEGVLLLLDREVLACLLAVALFSGMDNENENPTDQGFRGMRFGDGLIILALIVTFSRTALFASACVWLFLGRGSTWLRILFVLALLGAAACSLLTVLPLTADTVQLDGHLLWMAGVEYFLDLPEILLYVQGPALFSLSLPAALVANMGLPSKTELFYPEQIQSLWLRAALVWGMYGPGLLLAVTTLPAILRPTRMVSGLVALLVTQGTVFGLMYRPEVGVMLWLALIAGLASWKPKKARKEDTEEPWFAANDQ